LIPYPDLFDWWAATISAGSIFLVLVSIYLYIDSNKRRMESSQAKTSLLNVGYRFVFVWVLLGLLVFYIVSINIGSAAIFAVGNIIVEILLLVYLFKNKQAESSSSS